MASTNSMDSVLEFLRKNKFTTVEAALRNELNSRHDISGSLNRLSLEDKDMFNSIHVEKTSKSQNQVYNAQQSGEVSKELIVKEISCRTDGNDPEHKSKNVALMRGHSRTDDMTKTAERVFSFSKGSTESMIDPSWSFSQRINPINGDPIEGSSSDKFPEVLYEGKNSNPVVHGKMAAKVSETVVEEKRSLIDKAQSQVKIDGRHTKDQPVDKFWSRKDELVHPLSDICEDFKTVIPYLTADLLNGNNKGIAIKEKGVDDVGRDWYHEKLPQSSNSKEYLGQDFPLLLEASKEELPRLRPVRLKSEDKLLAINWEEKYDRNGKDVTGGNRSGGNWLSVSQGIAEDISDLVSGFATIGDELSESVDYPNEYWDSDEYDDDDDVGYTRETIEDEAWFLAHEVDYPSDNEKVTKHGRSLDGQDRGPTNTEDDDDRSFEEDCSFSGDHYYQSRNVEPVNASDNHLGFSIVEIHGEDENEAVAQQLIEEDELNLICGEPVWHGLLTQRTEFDMFGDGSVLNEYERAVLNEMHADNDRRGSVRSIGVGVGSDVAEIGGINGGDSDSHKKANKSGDHDGPNKKYKKYDGDIVAKRSRKSSDFSTARSSEDGNNANAEGSLNSSPSSLLSYNPESEHARNGRDNHVLGISEEVPAESVEDEEAAAIQEQLRQIKVQEEEFETFELKIVHRKNKTGFEEDKNFHVVLNSVIAGRYHVTEYLGSAAFSKAVQAHDLQTGMDVCVKIIKNNKDFFDQSLDEIKLLKYINKYDPADKYHILRLYDYFYYREHLLIVCELLKANLYEFQKFNRESGGEVYFTMPRLQSITIQCLEALQFLHSLGLIHCDLKPENILVKSYSRCEVKVIDLGSSCFETDNLCSYVQSRSYRAPEVILGTPYNQKIDIWSLGCILAELCSGNVLFQNDSLVTLLARVVGIMGPIDPYLLAKGKDAYKYFTKSHRLYERNQDTNSLEYLTPKKTSLRHRLPMGDQGFIEFVSYLLAVNPERRPTASEALSHPWLSFPYEPISS